jgi:hypothetical protein
MPSVVMLCLALRRGRTRLLVRSGLTRDGFRGRRASGSLLVTAIKLLHTVIWAILAGSIVALPFAGVLRRFRWAAILTGLVLLECAVLALNRGRCPLSDLAQRFTADRADNFDIYLPNWLARYNKDIFGVLFIAGELVVLW